MLEKLKQTLLGRKDTPAFRAPGQIQDGSRILVLVASDLADLLFHAPLLAAIRRTWPGVLVDFLVPETIAPLVVSSGLARRVIVYGTKQLVSWKPAFHNLQRTLAGGGYDVSIVVSREPHGPLEALGLASGALLRLGPSHGGAWPAVNLELRTAADGTGYLGDHLRQLWPFLGLEGGLHRNGWPLPTDKIRQVAQLVHFNKPRPEEWLVGIDPGADKSGRALSPDNLYFLVSQLKLQAHCRILPLCTPGNTDRMKQFESLLSSPVPPAFNRDTLLETLLLQSQCNLFIGGNTDLFHMAVAQKIPAIGLFGPHVESCWEPEGPRCAVLRIKKGEKVDIATLVDAVESVVADPDATQATTSVEAAPPTGPLPAPGT